jgi:hypothetical protein
VFTQLFQPWDRMLNTWKVITKKHPGCVCNSQVYPRLICAVSQHVDAWFSLHSLSLVFTEHSLSFCVSRARHV